MNNNRLGCLSGTALITTLITLITIVGAEVLSGGGMFSPGKLNAQPGESLGGVSSHAETGRQCRACHVPFWQNASMDERCLDCHTAVAAEGAPAEGVHTAILADPRLDCRDCHPEHRGPAAALTIVDENLFPHDTLGFSLKAHAAPAVDPSVPCQDCHAGQYDGFDQARCGSCHAQRDSAFMPAHTADFGEDCLACHDGVERYGQLFDHAATRYPLTGKHSEVLCAKCHLNARSAADLQATPEDCQSCHLQDDPHTGRFGSSCGDCHTPEAWSPAEFDHDLADFKLIGKHVEVECQECHQDREYRGTPTACAACHSEDDEHQGQFQVDCGTCHTPLDWEEITFDHNSAAFQLTGQHSGVECESCHKDGVYKGTPIECVACHKEDDEHMGRFGPNCAGCHNTSSWEEASFDHNLSVFKLTGAHLSVECTQCHVGGVFQGTPSVCYACHQKDDHHNGGFGTDCARCHNTTAWSDVNFDHSGFPLTGAHASLACTACHAGGNFNNASADCASCHDDPEYHRGLFGTDCAACHNTNNWNATYNGPHPKIDGEDGRRHEGAGCDDCHPTTLREATCLKCHDSNNPGDGGGGGDD